MTALDLIGADLVRALGQISAAPAVDQAVRGKAEALAAEIEAGAGHAVARVIRRSAGDYEVVVAGPGLFAREFGALDGRVEPIIAPAITRAGGGVA